MIFNNLKKIFLENIGIRQTIFKNTFWLTVADGISRSLEFIIVLFIIRSLGATEFGKLAFALAFITIFAILSDFGLPSIVIREFSGGRENEKEYPTILSLKIILSVGALVLTLLCGFFITNDPIVRKLIWILAVFVLTNNFFLIIYAFLRARQMMEYEALAIITRTVIVASSVFFILLKFPSIENVCYGYLISNSAVLILILAVFNFRIQPLKLGWKKDIFIKFFRYSWPLGVSAIFGAFFSNIDSVIMGNLGQITENGWYSAARKIATGAIIPASLIFMSFYPVLSKLFKESSTKLQKVWNNYMALMIILAAPLTAGGFILAPKIIAFFYGADYNPSIFAFEILIFMSGIAFIYNPYALILVASGKQKKYLWINIIAAMANIILNIILIPYYSLYGAAISLLITYIILIVLGVEFSRHIAPISVFNWQLLRVSAVAIFSSIIMAIIIIIPAIRNINIFFLIALGGAVYFSFLFLFRKLGLNLKIS
jgi:O-antigen/teichoic acid export membrane protein